MHHFLESFIIAKRLDYMHVLALALGVTVFSASVLYEYLDQDVVLPRASCSRELASV